MVTIMTQYNKKDLPRIYHSKVKEAREAIAAKALEMYEKYDRAITAALEAGQFDVAINAMQWAIEHMPKDEDGVSMIEPSIDKVTKDKGYVGPSINIGFQLGGINEQKALPEATIIDVEKEEDE